MVELYNGDCLEVMDRLIEKGIKVNFTLTDIPYDNVNRSDNGLRNLDKGNADVLTFDLNLFLDKVFELTSNQLCIFCGKEQFSFIYEYFANKKGTVRPIIWHKSNPSPMNGQHIYLSGVEMGVWFKKSGTKTFNAHCKNTVFKHPNGKSKLHPTEKNHSLLEELILDNSNDGDYVFDPCMGSGSHGLVSLINNRNFIGIELDETYFNIAKERIEKCIYEQGGLNEHFSMVKPNT